MPYTGNDHTFAVCAYKETPYLEACLRSLLRQSVSSRVILCAAEGNDFLNKISEKYGVPLYIRGGSPDIADDWNFAYRQAGTPLVTLAHQDDLYAPRFLEMTLRALNRVNRPLIAFTDYVEVRNGRKSGPEENRNLKIKKIMLTPFKIRPLADSRLIRRFVLSFGSPICCPSVTYVRKNAGEDLFAKGLKADLDWDAWEKISGLPGSFCYVPAALCAHRIHTGSATTQAITDSDRVREDYEMFRRFWPDAAARVLNRFYRKAQDQNRTGKHL